MDESPIVQITYRGVTTSRETFYSTPLRVLKLRATQSLDVARTTCNDKVKLIEADNTIWTRCKGDRGWTCRRPGRKPPTPRNEGPL